MRRAAAIALLLLASSAIAETPSAQKLEQCQDMKPSPARTQCFQVASRMAAAERAAIVATTIYTIVLYDGGSEVGRWQTKEMTQMNPAIEFTDLASGRRWRINGTYTIESSTERILETPTEEQEESD